MGLNPYSLSENILNKLPPGVRKKYNLQTAREALAKRAYRSEAKEQGEFASLLKLAKGRKELAYDWTRTDKKSTGVPGRPDFEVNLPGQTVFFEFKATLGSLLSNEQRQEKALLEFLGYKYYVVYSAKQAFEILTGLKAS